MIPLEGWRVHFLVAVDDREAFSLLGVRFLDEASCGWGDVQLVEGVVDFVSLRPDERTLVLFNRSVLGKAFGRRPKRQHALDLLVADMPGLEVKLSANIRHLQT